MGSPIIRVSLVGEAEKLSRAFRDAQRDAATFGDRMDRVGGAMQRTGTRMTLGLTVPIVAAGVAAFTALERIERISAQTDAAIASTGGAANVTTDQIMALANELENLTSVEAESIQEGQNLLLTFTKVKNEVGEGNDVFDQATRAALDMSVAMGTDMSSASMLVGKALNDPIRGLTALTRSGVQFTAEQKKMIEELVAAGDVMGAQKIILGELTTQFGGSGEALGNTMAGKIAIAKDAFGDIAQTLVTMVMPAIEGLVGWVQKAADWFHNLEPAGQKVVGIVIAAAAAIGPLILIGGKLVSSFTSIVKAFEVLKLAMAANPWLLLIAAVVALVVLIVANWDKITAFLARTWEWIKRTAGAVWDWLKNAFQAGLQFIINLFLNWTLPGLIIKNWDKIKAGVGALWDWLKNTWNGIVAWFQGIPAAIGKALEKVRDFLLAPFKAAFNAIAGIWNSTLGRVNFTIPGWIPGIGGKSFGFPRMPTLHGGGVFRAPVPGGEGFALLRDREVVQTPGQAARSSSPATVVHISVEAGISDPQAVATKVVEALQTYVRNNGAVPITVRG